MKYGLEYAGSRRVRRGWGACVVRAGLLVVLVAFLIWLVGSVLGVLRSAAQGTVRTTLGPLPLPLAMAATGGGVSPWVATVVAWGVLTLCLVGIGVHAWRRVMELNWPELEKLAEEERTGSDGSDGSDGSSRMCQCATTNTEPAEAGTTNDEGRAVR